jgi:S-DNA-T family DNA segregation ATPase FtsK/SpoIIIE
VAGRTERHDTSHPVLNGKHRAAYAAWRQVFKRGVEPTNVHQQFSTERLQQLIQAVFESIARRVDGELSLRQRHEQQLAAESERSSAEREQRTAHYEAERQQLQAEYDRKCAAAGTHYQAHYSAASEEYDEALRAINAQYEKEMSAATQEYDETRWMVVSYFDENAGGSPKQQFEQFEHNSINTGEHLESAGRELDELNESTIAMLTKRRMWTSPELPQPQKPAGSSDQLIEQFETSAERFRELAAQLKRRKLPMLFGGLVPFALFLLLAAGLTGLAFLVVDPGWLDLNDPPQHEWVALLSLGALLLTAMFLGIVFAVVRGGVEELYEQAAESLVAARTTSSVWRRVTERELEKRRREFDEWFGRLVNERDTRLLKNQERFDRLKKEYTNRRAQALNSANERYPAMMNSLTRQRDETLAMAHGEYPERLKKLKDRFEWDLQRLDERRQANLTVIHQQFATDWNEMAHNWLSAVEQTRITAEQMTGEAEPVSQAWADLAFGTWTPTSKIPTGVRLGDFRLRLDDIEYGVPEDERLVPTIVEFPLPAMLPFPDRTSMLIRATGSEGRQAAVNVLRVAMLRLLTTLPPGKVRFTIIDPIGLGENFSAFMHLVDYDELLVTSRIWTESTHIEQRLGDLTEHMETVFQTYLRNEFKTIEEYNDFAGEVAEPYHFLVIAGFPSNFTEQAARRLVSILSSGPRCGVYTLMRVDPQLTMPPNFKLATAAEAATCLTWHDGAFAFDDERINWLPLSMRDVPEPDEFVRIVKRVGDASKDARRVEVSFDRIAPRTLWQLDSRKGLDVPLGRAGATRLQHMRLGKGTSQHVLIAGKTGSGKSTFMHILITNLALHYSPDEVEFYLIDFKKGVEFKTYAANRLPHARVIAIESDREFGLSVLERLDEILKERGDLFRERGVQDIAGFRDANPERMPRIMLLIDEFQEFFTEDDRLSQQSSLLLDRLVRQGRAFGIHVMLGSQTLGGAYSLARSTLGQVAVRIALQCSESDAHLILSEENTAARLLTRPGEAIYNDENGLLEGNHPFQIAWLNDDRRDSLLEDVRHLTAEENIEFTPAIVFEGNVPASPANNRELVELVTNDPQPSLVTTAWLGEAVAIRPHTTVRFRRLAGANLLIVGQSQQGARGIMASVCVTAAAQIQPHSIDDVVFAEVPQAAAEFDSPTSEPSPSEQSSGGAAGDTPTGPDSLPDAARDDASMQSQLDAMKSFSFASLQIDNPVATSAAEVARPVGPAAQIYVLDGELADAPTVEFWSELARLLPHNIRVGGPGDVTAIIHDVHAELQLRQDCEPQPPVFLFIDNLGRFRDLRRDEEDYSFSSAKQAASTPAKQFVEILKNGPAAGIHVVVWADTYNNAGRWMTSQTMRELELRVAFQMSATDSSNFIDSPAAGRLGQNRALLYLEETGKLEKFRPYAALLDEWSALLSTGNAEDASSSLRREFGVDSGDHSGTARTGDSAGAGAWGESTAGSTDIVDDDGVGQAAGEAGMIPESAVIADDEFEDGDHGSGYESDEAASADTSVEEAAAGESPDAEEAEACDDLSSWTIL